MKTLLILPLTAAMLTIKATPSPPIKKLMISPFYLGKDSTIVIETNVSNVEFTIYLENDLYTSKAILSDLISDIGTYTYTYSNDYTRSRNNVYVTYSANGTTTTSSKVSRNITNGSIVWIEDNEPIVSQNTLAILNSNNVWQEKHIEYDFYNFSGYYSPDYFHKIDLSSFRILLDEDDSYFFSCSPTLVINNPNNVFNDIDGATNEVYFELDLVKNNNYFTFKLKKDIYVETDTLLLRSKGKLGYVKTRHIFFPRNDMMNQDKYEARFIFYDFGIDRNLAIYTFEIRALRNIFGDCSNSKYCIKRDIA